MPVVSFVSLPLYYCETLSLAVICFVVSFFIVMSASYVIFFLVCRLCVYCDGLQKVPSPTWNVLTVSSHCGESLSRFTYKLSNTCM